MPKVTVHKCAETIQGRKLFKGGNYLRKLNLPAQKALYGEHTDKNIIIIVEDGRSTAVI